MWKEKQPLSDNLGAGEELLLLDPESGIEKFCPMSNSSELLVSPSTGDPFVAFSLSGGPWNESKMVVLTVSRLLTFVHTDSGFVLQKTMNIWRPMGRDFLGMFPWRYLFLSLTSIALFRYTEVQERF